MIQAAIPVLFSIGNRMCDNDEAAASGKMIKPTIPAIAMDESCPIAVGHASVTIEARIAMVARSRSGQRERAVPQTAWTTTAAATTFRLATTRHRERSQTAYTESEGNKRKS
jgi:hypothetical protein